MNTKNNWLRILSITLLCCISMTVQASISGTGGITTRAFTGIWNQPAHYSQSTVIQIVSDGHGGLNAIVYWIAFDDGVRPYWYFAEGPVTGNRIDLTIYEARDPQTSPPGGPGDSNLQVWGAGMIEFDHCTKGTFAGVDSISGTGGFQFQINKVASVADTTCAGGLSDGINPSDSPVDIKSFFIATAAGAGSSGKAEFEVSAGRTSFKVEIEDLPVGDYGLNIEGINQGSIRVEALTGGGSKGEIEFRSPVESGKVLLTFDPRDKLVDVTNSASAVVLTQLFPDMPATGTGGLPGGEDLEISIEMTNTGVYPAGEAEAEFEQRPERSEFSVEIEDIPAGAYDLFVGTVFRGVITVEDLDGGTEGEIEFRSPSEAGKLLLDFDPRNQLIEVKQDTTVLFSTDFTPSDGGPDDRIELEFDLVNTGVDKDASGTFEYKKDGDRTTAEVEVEDLSEDGLYKLFFSNALKGIIMVEDGEGRWRFDTRQASIGLFPGSNPLGAKVSVRLDGVDILILNIPE